MTEIVGALATSRVASGDKFRVTWTWSLSQILPAFAFDAVGVSNRVREWLPSAGFVPVSNPSAVAGDEVIVYDVRLAMSWGGKTVADVVTALNDVPIALGVTRVEKVSLTATSTQLEQGQSDAISKGNDAATSLDDWLASLGSALKTTAGVVAIVAVVGVVAFLVYSARKR